MSYDYSREPLSELVIGCTFCIVRVDKSFQNDLHWTKPALEQCYTTESFVEIRRQRITDAFIDIIVDVDMDAEVTGDLLTRPSDDEVFC